MKRKPPYVNRRKITNRESVEISEMKQQISDLYKKYDEAIIELGKISFKDKKYDQLTSQMNEYSLKINIIKQQIQHVIKTGMKNGLSLDTGYVDYSK